MGIFDNLNPVKLGQKLFHQDNPADKALPIAEQIPGATKPYYENYINRGEGASNRFNEHTQMLQESPGAFLEQLSQGYTPSKGFQFQRNNALKSMQEASKAGGYGGGQADQERQGAFAYELANQDYYNWLDKVLGLHTQGLGGQQHVGDQGQMASGQYGDIVGNSLNQRAGLAFQGQAQKNANKTATLNSIISAIGQIGGGGIW